MAELNIQNKRFYHLMKLWEHLSESDQQYVFIYLLARSGALDDEGMYLNLQNEMKNRFSII